MRGGDPAVDPLPATRERALDFGADAALDPADPELAVKVRRETGGLGLAAAFDFATMVFPDRVTRPPLPATWAGPLVVAPPSVTRPASPEDVDDVQVSVTRLVPNLPAPRLELLHYHTGTRRPIPCDTASNDIVATHSVIRVASLGATAAALARRGTPLGDDDLMILRGGIRAALVAGPDGHRFLAEEQATAKRGGW